MDTELAVRIIAESNLDGVFVCSNGAISRWAYTCLPKARTFFMLGSMGMAPNIALGLSMVKPDIPINVIDGDGNLLMDLSAINSIARIAPTQFRHFCINNGLYMATGGQKNLSSPGLFRRIARDAGYTSSELVRTQEQLTEVCSKLHGLCGTSFFEIEVEDNLMKDLPPRVELSCEEIVQNIKYCV